MPIPGRPERIADMAMRWITMKRTPVDQRKVAILVWQYTSDGLAAAAGLDTPKSIIDILRRLKEDGYTANLPSWIRFCKNISGQSVMQKRTRQKNCWVKFIQ
jgi:cobalamin biosynthesis Mg chelatase CobN